MWPIIHILGYNLAMKFLAWLKKYWWLILIGVAVGVLWYRGAESKKQKEIKEKTYKVVRQDIVDALELSGGLDAQEKVTLKFQTSGLLTWVGVKEGDTVKKYQTIASLDKRELQNSMTQYLNTYSKARNDFEQAQSDNKDWQTNGMTDVAREAIKRTLSSEQMDLNNSVLALEAKDLALKFSSLYTPIAGIVTKIDSPLAGQNITPTTATFEVINPKTLYFSALADQTEVTKFVVGQKGVVSLDAFPDKKLETMVSSVAFTPKTGNTGTVYEIKMSLDASSSAQGLKMGMTGDVSFTFGEKKQVLAVPEKYVKEKVGKKYVTVMENGKNKDVFVETGYEADNMIEIVSGLKENDLIYN